MRFCSVCCRLSQSSVAFAREREAQTYINDDAQLASDWNAAGVRRNAVINQFGMRIAFVAASGATEPKSPRSEALVQLRQATRPRGRRRARASPNGTGRAEITRSVRPGVRGE